MPVPCSRCWVSRVCCFGGDPEFSLQARKGSEARSTRIGPRPLDAEYTEQTYNLIHHKGTKTQSSSIHQRQGFLRASLSLWLNSGKIRCLHCRWAGFLCRTWLARMAELADAVDSKSTDRKVLGVRPPLWAPSHHLDPCQGRKLLEPLSERQLGGVRVSPIGQTQTLVPG